MNIAIKYITKEKEIGVLKSTLLDSNIPENEKATILHILDQGGVRTSLMF